MKFRCWFFGHNPMPIRNGRRHWRCTRCQWGEPTCWEEGWTERFYAWLVMTWRYRINRDPDNPS